MAQAVLSPSQSNWSDSLSSKRMMKELRSRIDYNIENLPGWRLLRTELEDIIVSICKVLQSYMTLWVPREHLVTKNLEIGSSDHEISSTDFDRPTAIKLLTAAEEDFGKGLGFVREVEKSSHMKNDAMLNFRRDAIESLCDLVRNQISEMMARESSVIDDDDIDEDDKKEVKESSEMYSNEEDASRETERSYGDADRTPMSKAVVQIDEGITHLRMYQNMQATETTKCARQKVYDLVRTVSVYEQVERAFEERLRVLVHQHKKKAAKGRKK